MFVVWIIVAVVLLVASFGVTCAGFSPFVDERDGAGKSDREDFLAILRYLSICTAAGWTLAIFWPLILAAIIPALIIYGLWSAVRVAKNKSLNYPVEDATLREG